MILVDKIIVLKSIGKNPNIVLSSEIYATATKPKESFTCFVLLKESDGIEVKVAAVGCITAPRDITPSTLKLFGEDGENWSYEYELSNVIKLEHTWASDVFLQKDVDQKICVQQYGYVEALKASFLQTIRTINSNHPILTAGLNNGIQNNNVIQPTCNKVYKKYTCPFKIGMNVKHATYGEGKITKIEEFKNENLLSEDFKVNIHFSNGIESKVFSALVTEKQIKILE